MIREAPPPAWRPTPRTMADISLAARVIAGAIPMSMVESTLGMGCALAGAGWLAKRTLDNGRLTNGVRYHWKRRAFAVVAQNAGMGRALLTGEWPGVFGDPVTHYVDVKPEDWVPAGPAIPPEPQAGLGAHLREWKAYRRRARLEGLRVVPRRVYCAVNPQAIINWRQFRRHFNEIMGFPGTEDRPVDPWRWDKRRGHDLIVGEPFSLPPVVPFPEPAFWDPDIIHLGLLEDGTELVWDLNPERGIPHGLLGGSTRFGKTGLLRLIAYHFVMAAWARGNHPGVVILDPKGDQFTAFERAGYWKASTVEGIHVAADDLDEQGNLVNLNNMAAAARAVRMELGRRRRTSRRAAAAGEQPAWRPIILLVDEAADLLKREDAPPQNDQGDEANAVRARNAQRREIERTIQVVARMGAQYRVHVIAATQSPRAEFLPGDVKVNLAFLLFVGPGSPTELGIIFGKDLPDSPPARRGMGVWKDYRENTDPLDPYLYFKAYWLDPSVIARSLEWALAA